MRSWKSFPAIVFLVLSFLIEAVILTAVHLNNPADIPLMHGVKTSRGADPVINSDAIDAFMVENIRRTGVPGAILAVVKGDKIIHTAGYGFTTSGDKVTTDTVMPIASLSKSMTAAAIMKLVDYGVLSLDKPVHSYLPGFKPADPRGALITVRHLLNQSSGLADRALPPDPSNPPDSLSEEMIRLNNARLVNDPGKSFNYCNENYFLLARMAERRMDIPFDKFLESTLFKPLQMDASHVYFRPGDAVPDVRRGSQLIYGLAVPWDVPREVSSGAGGVVSSAHDLSRWLLFNTRAGRGPDGTQLISPENINEMHTASVPGSNYGFGWRQDILDSGITNVHHSGIARAFTAHESFFPNTGYAYAFVLNGGHFFRVGAASFRYGLDAIMMGKKPDMDWPFSLFGRSLDFIADNLMALLTAAVLTIGTVGSLRARNWSENRSSSSWIATGIRMTPYIIILVPLLALPWLLSVINRGQPVEFSVIFSYWPPLCIFFFSAVFSAVSVTAVRVIYIISLKRKRFRLK